MDRKSIIVLVVCGILFVGWFELVQRLYPPQRSVQRTNAPGLSSNAVAASSNASGASTALTPDLEATRLPVPEGPEQTLVLSNALARYTFTSHGGGLKQVELLKYPESVSCNQRQAAPSQRLASLNSSAREPILALSGGTALTGDGQFKLTAYTTPVLGQSNAAPRMTSGVRAEKELGNGLYLVKEFELASNYLVNVRTRLHNRGNQPVLLPAEHWVVGTATPLSPQDDGTLMGAHWYDGRSDSQVSSSYFDNKTLGCFPGTPRSIYDVSDKPVAWATAHNQFFFTALMPQTPAAGVVAVRYPLPPPSPEEIAANSRTVINPSAYQVDLKYPATNLLAGQALDRDFILFAGPKEYRTLDQIGYALHNDLDRIMGYGGFWGFFSQILLRSMNGLNSLGLSYGMAIIAITVIIKLLFWPLTAISTRASKRMQLLQPQMKALQDKYKEDPVKMQKKLMEFMKEHKVSPMSGCWPVLLQTPVLIGFFTMVRSAIELRGASFLWACDLSKSDTIWVIPGLHLNVNPLPLLMGATMFWQARLMPPSPGMDPMQQKIMKYFPMVFLVILYNYSAGLTLYWTVQNLLSIAQIKLTRAADEKKAVSPSGPRPGSAPAQPKKKK